MLGLISSISRTGTLLLLSRTKPIHSIPFPTLSMSSNTKKSSTGDGWERSWKEGVVPWDLGQPTTILLHLLHTDSLPKGRVLVPGCGSLSYTNIFAFFCVWRGHDVVAIASTDRFVVGLDISDSAIKTAIKLSSSSPKADYRTLIKTDFFTWHPTELFDLVFDYTFLCAIEPDMRSAWASRIQDLLKPDGELITLMFPISGHAGGPPYKVSVEDYEEVLDPVGFKAISVLENELSIGPRKGRGDAGKVEEVHTNTILAIMTISPVPFGCTIIGYNWIKVCWMGRFVIQVIDFYVLDEQEPNSLPKLDVKSQKSHQRFRCHIVVFQLETVPFTVTVVVLIKKTLPV